MSFGLLKMLATNYSFTHHLYVIFMYKQNLTLNNLQGMIWRKTQPTNQPSMHHLSTQPFKKDK